MNGHKATGSVRQQERIAGMEEGNKKRCEDVSPRREVARQVREARKAEGMTQEYLAELVGTKKSNISRLESGRYNPSLEFLEKVADGLGKKVEIYVR